MARQPNIFEFKAGLRKDFPTVLIIGGGDPTLPNWCVDQARRLLAKELKLRDDSHLKDHVFTFIGGESTLSDFYNDFFTVPLFGGARLFIVREAISFFAAALKGSGPEKKQINADLTSKLADIPPQTRLILIDQKADIPKGLLKLFPNPVYFKNRDLYANEKERYLRETLEQEKLTVTDSAFAFLLEISGGQPAQIRVALSQIRQSLGDPPPEQLDYDQVAEAIDIETTNSLFQFINFLFNQQLDRALRLLPHLDLQQGSSLGLLSLILAEFQRVRRYQVLAGAGPLPDKNELYRLLSLPGNSDWFKQKKLAEIQAWSRLLDRARLIKISLLLNRLQRDFKYLVHNTDHQVKMLEDLVMSFAGD